MNRIQEALAQLRYEQSPHVRHKHDLLQTIRHFASAASDAELVSQAGQEIERLICRSTLPPGTLKAGSIQPAYWQTADWRKLGRFHVMNAYGRSACGGGMDLIEHEAIDASLVPDANRCRRAGCKETWPTEGATAASLNVEQLETCWASCTRCSVRWTRPRRYSTRWLLL